MNRLADLCTPQAKPSPVIGLTPVVRGEGPFSVRSLTVEGMSFSYSEQYPVFSLLDLDFERGVAHLVNGGNGAGKSTLLTILSGALMPREGCVRLDGQDLASLADKSRWITYVPQRIRIISDTIRNNITFGASFETADVEAVLGKVGLGDWVARLDGGIDHVVRDANTELSGGQVQKIGLARALLRDTPILLMDEPTNNLDSQAVKLLLATIRQYKHDRIVVIVSHDDRIFDAVDRVIYLENDSVTESTRVTVTLPDSCRRFVDEAK